VANNIDFPTDLQGVRDVTREDSGNAAKKGGKGSVSENVSTGSRLEFLSRLQRFTDEILDSLSRVSGGKDADEKEARALRSVLLKLLSVWDKSLVDGQRDPRLAEMLRRVEKQTSQIKSEEG
jgi:hypothetical protein